jgi:hypothetical protein
MSGIVLMYERKYASIRMPVGGMLMVPPGMFFMISRTRVELSKRAAKSWSPASLK